MNMLIVSNNYRGRWVCVGCGCLATVINKRCVNWTCQYYKPGVFGHKVG